MSSESTLTPASVGSVCPRDVITLTCTVEGDFLQWILFRQPSMLGQPLQTFSQTYTDTTDSSVIGLLLSLEDGVYNITLDSVEISPARITSTLVLTAARFLDQQMIECTGDSVTIHFHGE